jgi:hypothetical protein
MRAIVFIIFYLESDFFIWSFNLQFQYSLVRHWYYNVWDPKDKMPTTWYPGKQIMSSRKERTKPGTDKKWKKGQWDWSKLNKGRDIPNGVGTVDRGLPAACKVFAFYPKCDKMCAECAGEWHDVTGASKLALTIFPLLAAQNKVLVPKFYATLDLGVWCYLTLSSLLSLYNVYAPGTFSKNITRICPHFICYNLYIFPILILSKTQSRNILEKSYSRSSC